MANYIEMIPLAAKAGYKGYVAQEFIPTKKGKAEQLAALSKGVTICDV